MHGRVVKSELGFTADVSKADEGQQVGGRGLEPWSLAAQRRNRGHFACRENTADDLTRERLTEGSPFMKSLQS